MTTVTAQDIGSIVAEARHAANVAARRYFNDKLGGVDQYSCGFASVEIYGIRGNTRLGRAFKAAGLNKNYNGAFYIWNPSGLAVQNIDTLEAGAEAAAKVFERHGFRAYATSRLD
jgi:outer membrane cobalamin receptor